MSKPVFSIRMNPDLHQRLKREVKREELTKFIEEAIDRKLAEKGNIEQKLIADYQSVAKNKKLQEEATIWDETLNDAWKKNE